MFKKGGAIAKHGNKAFNGLSAAAICWMFATFATKSDVDLLNKRCDRCDEKRALQWQRLMDHEVALAKSGVTVVRADWKEITP